MTNSRRKGVAGEKEFTYLLREYGIEARRGQQHKGTPDSPDVVTALDSLFHFEVKYLRSGLNIYAALEQALEQKADFQSPVVAYRKVSRQNRGLPWVVCLYADDFLGLIRDSGVVLNENAATSHLALDDGESLDLGDPLDEKEAP